MQHVNGCRRFPFFTAVLLGIALSTFCPAAPPYPQKLPAHPRLFLTKKREAEIKKTAKDDKFLDHQVRELIGKADGMLKQNVSVYEIPDGKRLLAQSRRSLDRTSILAFAYRMTGREEYAAAARAEMLAVCRFKDWNPSHFLDTAEMATAVGIGYDWLYDVIPEEERREICAAMVKHAMNTGIEVYEKKGWWSTGHNNWNEVCNAGMTIGAIAIADEEPELAKKAITFAIRSLPNGLSVYKPDGAYPEGPIYWSYGATFTGMMLAALEDVFGNDFDLLKTPGLSVTGDYYMGMIGPTFRNFNYADCSEGAAASPMMFYLSTRYNRPDYAVWYREFLIKKKAFRSERYAVFNAIWYNPRGSASVIARTPLARKFTGIQDVVTMRTSWTEPNAAFLGFKGGDNKANHGHLDIGSFIYEVGGVRWACDLGADNYNMPGYFGRERWTYYRNINKSHNTLVIGDKIQDPKAVARIVEFNTGVGVGKAVCNMGPAYAGQAKSARRTMILQKNGTLEMEDLVGGVNEPVRWGMMTRAEIKIDGKKALLIQDKKTLLIEVVSDQVQGFEILSVTPPKEIENQNKGYSMLAAIATPQEGRVAIRVTFKPNSK